MIFLSLLSLFFLPLDGIYLNSPITHFSDSLRLKCDALPYRTAYVGTRCYFAVLDVAKLEDAQVKCSFVFAGAKIETNAPTSVFNSMMLDNSKFHAGKDSSGAKQSICMIDSKYVCDEGQPSPIFPGKCILIDDNKKIYREAKTYCESRGMELASISNDLENRMFRGALIKDPAWIQYEYHWKKRKWASATNFGRFGMCQKPPGQYASYTVVKCTGTWDSAVAIDKTGYWYHKMIDIQNWKWDVLCVKDAQNQFTTGKKTCVELHTWDEQTQSCKWTGQKDACIQLISHKNETWFMSMPKFPKETYTEFQYENSDKRNNNAVKVIVRKGCMFVGYRHGLENMAHGNFGHKPILIDHRRYGAHIVPSSHNKMLSDWWEGLSRSLCFCDPTEATINDHAATDPPASTKCIEHHEFDEETQSCEWKLEPKYCAELITHDGRRQVVEMPNWPNNRKYDVDHWANKTKKAENFAVGSVPGYVARGPGFNPRARQSIATRPLPQANQAWSNWYWCKTRSKGTVSPAGN